MGGRMGDTAGLFPGPSGVVHALSSSLHFGLWALQKHLGVLWGHSELSMRDGCPWAVGTQLKVQHRLQAAALDSGSLHANKASFNCVSFDSKPRR